MAETQSKTKRSSLGKKLAIVAGALVLVVVVAYFVVTSGAFFKSFILPRVGEAMNADISVAEASIQPFSQVALQKLKVQPRGAETLLQAESLVARYNLRAILGGNIDVSELTLQSPVIRIVETPEGKSNLDPLLPKEEPSKEPKAEEPPPTVNIRNVSLKNATVEHIKRHKDGREDRAELSGLNLSVDRLQNGAAGVLEVSSAIKYSTALGAQSDRLDASLSGKFDYALTKKLDPESLKGSANLDVKQASGQFQDLAGLNAALRADLTPQEIRALALHFSQRGKSLGEIRASGPFDPAKVEEKLQVEISSIDRQVLNLVGAPLKMDFGTTKVSSSNIIELAKGGQSVSVQGQLRGNAFSVTHEGHTTPRMDLAADYDLLVDQASEMADVRTFNLVGRQNNRQLLAASLSKPIKLNWGKGADAVDESAFELVVNELNLADWRAFAADLNPSGTASLKLSAVAEQAGKKVRFDLTTALGNVGATLDTNRVEAVDLTLVARGVLQDFDRLNLEEARGELARRKQPVATFAVSGNYAIKAGEADLQARLEGTLARLLELSPVAELSASAGTVRFEGRVKQSGETQTINGLLNLDNFTGSYGDYRFQNFYTSAKTDLDLKGNELLLRQMETVFRQANEPGGSASVTGRYHLEKATGQFDVTLDQLNQRVLGPVLESSLGDRKLASATLAGQVKATLESTNLMEVKADVRLGNFVVLEPGSASAPSPLSGQFRADVSLKNETQLHIRQCSADLEYGGQPAGGFDLSGRLDTARTVGQLELKLKEINQHAIKPFVPELGGRELVTAAVAGNASANLEGTNRAAVKADFKIANLVLKDPKQAKADPPLSAALSVDAAMEKQILQLRQCELTLSPTARAKNQAQVSGSLDLSKTNAISGALQLAAESLDITPFYDLLSADTNGAPAATTAATSDPQTEPEPMELPVGKLDLTVNIGQLHLREITASGLQAKGSVQGSKVSLKPVQLAVNGAPVTASVDLDLGVRGYAYDVSLNADKIPLEPLANSFMPDKRGQYQGQVLAQMAIKGKGTTGASLRQHLNGQANVGFTNANIQVVGPKLRRVLVPIAALLRVSEITESPVNWIDTRLVMGNGMVDVSKFAVESEAFQATAQGQIPLADVLTNSPMNKLPVNFYLRRSLAQKAGLMPGDAPADAKYVKLPNFVKLTGTLGEPKADLNELVIAGMIGRSGAGLVGGEAGKIIKGVGGILTGQPPVTPPSTNGVNRTNQLSGATNAPSTNIVPPAVNQLLDLFKKPKN